MQWQRGLIAAGACFCLLHSPPMLLAGGATGRPSALAVASPREILTAAFSNRYSVDLVSRIKLVMYGRRGQQRERTLVAASKVVNGRVYSIGRLVSPAYLRDMTVLMMERSDRGEDAFIFFPSLDKVRRITTAQRSDAFFGSDVTYEDIEQQRADDFEIDSMKEEIFRGEAIYRIKARPSRRENYEQVIFAVAQKDAALLNIQYYKRGSNEAFRIIDAPREDMVVLGGHVLPTRINVENHVRGTRTEVLLTKMSADHEIPDRIFSVRTLESRSPIPQLP